MRYFPKSIVHIWRRHSLKRLVPVVGSGASADLGIPDWQELVRLLASNPAIDYQGNLDNFSPASSTEHIYHYYYAKFRKKLFRGIHLGPSEAEVYQKFRADWREKIRISLYGPILHGKNSSKFPTEELSEADRKRIDHMLRQGIENHPFLEYLFDVVRQAPLTINYNFDDCLQRLISMHLREADREKEGRGYETFVTPMPNSQRDNCKIYHPNGFLPLSRLERASDSVSLTESDLIGQTLPRYEAESVLLRSVLQTHTTLVIGMSFSDVAQKRIYQEGKERSPGNIHYLLQFLSPDGDDEERSLRRQAALENARTNFLAYRVLALPLFPDEFKPFLKLLSSAQQTLEELAHKCDVPCSYRYYLVGAPGTGKSSVSDQLGCFDVYSEWPDERPDLLAKDPKDLTDQERNDVDNWIDGQFRIKNRRLSRDPIGIYVVDRSPLDPLTYQSDSDSLKKRAQSLREAIGKQTSLADGHVFRLEAAASEMQLRLLPQQKTITGSSLKEIANRTRELYQGEGVTEIDTRSLSLKDVVTMITNNIVLSHKENLDLDSLLSKALR